MAVVTLKINALHKAEMEYYGKFGHTIGQIQYIDIMRRNDIYYTTFRFGNQTVLYPFPGLWYQEMYSISV